MSKLNSRLWNGSGVFPTKTPDLYARRGHVIGTLPGEGSAAAGQMLKRSDRRTDPGIAGRKPCLNLAFVLILACFLTIGLFLIPTPVSANSGGYTTPSFDVNVVTDEDHVFHVSEEIQVDFSEYRHGVYRYIPDGSRYYGIRNVNVEGYTFDTYHESGNLVIQIGDPDYTVIGPQLYRITYDIVGYRDDSDTQDYLSIDLLPTGWSTDIDSASLRIEFPKEIDNIESFAGLYGDTGDPAEYFNVKNTGLVYTAVSKQTLPQGLGLTIKADLPEGYWVDPYSRDEKVPILCGLLAVMGMLMLLLWLFVGRDEPIIQTVEFYPPEEMDPLEIAYVGNGEVKSKDISSLFLYMASKGYVRVESDGKKSFTLIRTKDVDPSERGHTRKIYRKLFFRGDEVRLRKLPDGFGDVAAEVPGEVAKIVEGRRPSFSAISKVGRAIGLAFCLLIPLTAILAYNWLTYGGGGTRLIIGIVLSIIIFVSMRMMVGKTDSFRTKKRMVRIVVGFIVMLAAVAAEAAMIITDYPLLALVFVCSILAAIVATLFVRRRMNNELYGRVLGFREFIRTAEYDRLKMLSEEDPEYFFNIMPYACVFGMSSKWADKFSDFRIPQPSWYTSTSGTWDPFFGHYMYMYTGNSVANAVAHHYKAVGAGMLSSAVDSATSGGFGGGGFSGGGFGGGGGGSW